MPTKVFITYDIEGLKIGKNLRANYMTTLELIDSTGKTAFKKDTPNDVALQLGGTRMPGDLFVILPPSQKPGKHKIRLTVKDNLANETKSFEYPFDVIAAEFAFVGVSAPAVRFPGQDGESLSGVQERAVAAIRDWNARLGPRAAYLVCSHGDFIKSILADGLGMHLDMFQRIQVDPCSVSVIRYTPLRPFVIRMNDTGTGWPRPARAAGAESAARRPETANGQTAGHSGLSEGDAVIGGGAGG